VLEADVLGRMAEVLSDHFAGDEALARVRARLEARRQRRAGEAARNTSRQRRRLQALAGQIDRATRNLALAHTEADFRRVSAAIDAWEKERAALAAELEEAERRADAEERQDGLVEQALAELAALGEVLGGAPPGEVARVARAMIERVELAFVHQDLPSGRTRSVCTGGTIHLRDDLGVSRTTGFRLRNSANTSRQRRVRPRRRSTGW
jgi:hypothetical protein